MARQIDSLGHIHVAFEDWAKECGITINGVGATRFHGQGLGIAALRKIDAGEIIVTVPTSAMLTPESIPQAFKDQFGDKISVHGLMAAFLCCGDSQDVSKYAAWWAAWPSLEDFEENMPMLWPEHLKEQLHRETPSTRTITEYPPPPEAKSRSSMSGPLVHQEKKLEKCFQTVKSVFPDTDRMRYCYYWLIVNTRSFYHIPSGKDIPKEKNDALALCPYADYFNHTDVGNCEVSFDKDGYTVRTTKPYEPGEEIYVCYGQHTSDFLQIEYGFVPDTNKWDTINLDSVILTDLNDDFQNELLEESYFGNYQLTSSDSEPCYRTEVAACIEYMTARDWRAFVHGHTSSPYDGLKSNETIRMWILEYKQEAEMVIGQLVVDYGVDGEGGDVRVMTVLRRWRQVVELCERGLKYLRM